MSGQPNTGANEETPSVPPIRGKLVVEFKRELPKTLTAYSPLPIGLLVVGENEGNPKEKLGFSRDCIATYSVIVLYREELPPVVRQEQLPDIFDQQLQKGW